LTPARAPAGRARAYLALLIGVLAVSSAAILVSLARAQGAPAILIAALRMAAAALVVVPISLARCRAEILSLRPRALLLAIASGACLALHFAFWISSLDYTSVMSSVVFVSTNPLFVGLASVLILRERLGRWTLIGVLVAVIGGGIVGLADLRATGGQSLKGDALALLGAVSVSGYLLIGRTLRKTMSLTLYVGIAYATAAIVLLAVVGITATRVTGYPPAAYLWIALLAAGPQLLGHTAYNWALKYVSATLVTVTLLAEPIGATLLGIPVLGQVPEPAAVAGGVLILGGIFLAARAEARAVRGERPTTPPLG
jgi:drug/metabolite transporter (DMT)-like permease